MAIGILEEDLLSFAAADFLIRCRPCIINVDMLISTSEIAEAVNRLDFGVPRWISSSHG
jgi:hypothetical protein